MRTCSVAVSALLLVSVAHSATIEEWECRDYKYNSSENILAEAKVNEGGTTGGISVAGVTHKTSYEVTGFERRWDFGLRKDSTYAYSFVISPDGMGRYYDFGSSKSTKPSILMRCLQRPLQ